MGAGVSVNVGLVIDFHVQYLQADPTTVVACGSVAPRSQATRKCLR